MDCALQQGESSGEELFFNREINVRRFVGLAMHGGCFICKSQIVMLSIVEC